MSAAGTSKAECSKTEAKESKKLMKRKKEAKRKEEAETSNQQESSKEEEESPLEIALRELKTSLLEFDDEGKKIHRLSCIEKIKCKQSWKRGIPAKSRKHAQNVVKNSNIYNNYVQISKRLEKIIDFVENAISKGKVKSNTEPFVKNILLLLQKGDLKQVDKVIEKFENEIDDNRPKSALRPLGTTAVSLNALPDQDVDSVMKEVMEEIQEEMLTNFQASSSDDEDEEDIEIIKMISDYGH